MFDDAGKTEDFPRLIKLNRENPPHQLPDDIYCANPFVKSYFIPLTTRKYLFEKRTQTKTHI